MFALIRQWESSGQSQEQFVIQQGIAISTFGYWRRKYLKETAQGEKHFIPVKIARDSYTENSQGVLELVYPNGVRLVCSASMDLSRLKPLIVL